jgi:chromosome segregation ATPase
MSNDLNFLNTYTEVVQENVSAIIKQNFVFQTQLKLAENQLAILEDAKRTVDALSIQNKNLQSKVDELTDLTSTFKNSIDDKSRLQVSLNEESQIKNQLQAQMNDMQQELTRLRNQSEQYEIMKKENAAMKKKLGVEEPKSNKKTEKPAVQKEAIAGTF